MDINIRIEIDIAQFRFGKSLHGKVNQFDRFVKVSQMNELTYWQVNATCWQVYQELIASISPFVFAFHTSLKT